MKYIFRETDCGDGRRYRWSVGKGGGGGWIGASPSYTLLKIGIIKVLKIFLTPPFPNQFASDNNAR